MVVGAVSDYSEPDFHFAQDKRLEGCDEEARIYLERPLGYTEDVGFAKHAATGETEQQPYVDLVSYQVEYLMGCWLAMHAMRGYRLVSEAHTQCEAKDNTAAGTNFRCQFADELIVSPKEVYCCGSVVEVDRQAVDDGNLEDLAGHREDPGAGGRNDAEDTQGRHWVDEESNEDDHSR